MQPQIIQDSNGVNTGIFIPICKRMLVKSVCQNVEDVDTEIPVWQQELLTQRLTVIKANPKKLLHIDNLFNEPCID
jgi:hypothetical protein